MIFLALGSDWMDTGKEVQTGERRVYSDHHGRWDTSAISSRRLATMPTNGESRAGKRLHWSLRIMQDLGLNRWRRGM
jgi:hypothetical protein